MITDANPSERTTYTDGNVYTGPSRFGTGVFASRHIKKGEGIFRFTGRSITFDESVALGDDECYSVQVSVHGYLQPDAPGKFVNHSCDPNCGLDNNLILRAIKDIREGEELFFDYSTTMLERRWEMDCKCGSSSCRGRIRDFDSLPESLQAYYAHCGVVQEFILDWLFDTKTIMDR